MDHWKGFGGDAFCLTNAGGCGWEGLILGGVAMTSFSRQLPWKRTAAVLAKFFSGACHWNLVSTWGFAACFVVVCSAKAVASAGNSKRTMVGLSVAVMWAQEGRPKDDACSCECQADTQ